MAPELMGLIGVVVLLLLLAEGVPIGVGTGAMALVFGAIVANRWFVRHRGLITGVFSAASSTGQLIFLPAIAHLAHGPGWRWAAGLVAGFALLLVPVVLLVMRDRPSDVGWDAQGNIFVSDGYGNSRVVKYDKDGRYITSAGTKGSGPGQLNLPHSLSVDAKGNVYIADRTNNRIQVWDNDLKFKTMYENVGTPWELCISPGPHQYLYSSNTFPDANNYAVANQTGEVYKMELDGTVLGKFGKAGKQLGEFSGLHEIDCRNPNELYISEIQLWRAQKIVLRPATK